MLISVFIYAKDQKIELGMGVFALSYPDYVGSTSSQFLTGPFPYIRYRGKYLTIDENGISRKLLGVNGLRLDLSVSGSLPANSEDSKVRNGMPDLDLTGEIGPQLIYDIYSSNALEVSLELPVRAVLSTDFTNIRYRGIIATPQLKLGLNYNKFEWTFRSGLRFTNEKYHNYFYGVQELYVTQTRDEYEAPSGYNGFRNRMGVSFQSGNWWAGAFASHYNLHAVAYKDSPLVETKSNFYMGASVAYIFYTQKH